MRYTPFLDSVGVAFKDDVPDHAANVIDNCLSLLSAQVKWGEWQGRRRKPCPEQPMLLTGMPIGMYHCPACGMMVMAAMPHPSPAAPLVQDDRYPLDDYEVEYAQEWPPGYEEAEA